MGKENPNARQIRDFRTLCLGIAALVTLAIGLNFSYLRPEHERLELWKILGTSVADVTALVWFVRFAIVHAILGRTWEDISAINRRRTLKGLAVSGFVAIFVDLSLTLYVMYDESVGYAHGKVVEARIETLRERFRPEAIWYEMGVAFTDESGKFRHAHVRVHLVCKPRETGHPAPSTVLGAYGLDHNLIHLRYDPRHPERAWFDGLGWHDGNGFYVISLATLAIQSFITFPFLLFCWQSKGEPVTTSWGFLNLIPVVIEAGFLSMAGVIDLIMDF
jgi:hypothetical protein